IAPVKYQQYQHNFDIPGLRKLVADRLINDSAFTAVGKYNSWVEAQENKKISLKLTDFRIRIEENNRYYLQVMAAMALSEEKRLNIMPLSNDSLVSEGDRKTLKILSRDIYLNEAILTVNDMLGKTVMNTMTHQ
ncbi:MAG TPA: carboxy terminal-processing peptidase, partial [Pedobacter sp.]